MKLFHKQNKNGKVGIYLFGIKILSYKIKHRKLSQLEYVRNLGVKVGENTSFIQYPNFGSEPFLIEIGSDCLISFGCTFLTHDGSRKICMKYIDKKFHKDLMTWKKIKIGNNCFIGCNSTIMPGVTIGDNVVIGACSVVTKDIPDGEVWAGNPVKFIKKTPQLAEKILQYSLSDEAEKIRLNYHEQYQRVKQL